MKDKIYTWISNHMPEALVYKVVVYANAVAKLQHYRKYKNERVMTAMDTVEYWKNRAK